MEVVKASYNRSAESNSKGEVAHAHNLPLGEQQSKECLASAPVRLVEHSVAPARLILGTCLLWGEYSVAGDHSKGCSGQGRSSACESSN